MEKLSACMHEILDLLVDIPTNLKKKKKKKKSKKFEHLNFCKLDLKRITSDPVHLNRFIYLDWKFW